MPTNAAFIQEAHTINYIPAAAVAAGQVVLLGDLIGVAPEPIAAGALGSLCLHGAFSVLKSGSSGPVFAVGDVVGWDLVNLTAVRVGLAAAGVVPVGTCIEAAGASDTRVYTRLNPQTLPAALQGKAWEDLSLTGASKTLDAEDVGKVMNVTAGSATNVITLPATAAGLKYVIRSGITGAAATTANRIAISPNAVDKVMGADLAGVDNKDHILASTTVVAGDYTELVADGVNGYFAHSERGIWTNEP